MTPAYRLELELPGLTAMANIASGKSTRSFRVMGNPPVFNAQIPGDSF